MPTRLIQLEAHPPGSAVLQVSGPAAQMPLPEAIEISIVQPGPTERYLDPRNPDDPWTTALYRFRPLNPRRQGSALWLDIDYGVTYHLRANQPYKLRIRQFEGLESEEIFTGPAALRRPSAKPVGWTPPPDPSGPLAAPAPAPAAPAAAAAPVVAPPSAPAAAPQPEPEPLPAAAPAPDDSPTIVAAPRASGTPAAGGRSRKPLAALLAVLLVAAAVGGYLLWSPAPKQAPAMAAAAETTLADVRKTIAAGPDAAAAREQANRLAQAGKLLDGQFLLYKYAAEKGDREAARRMGAFYDPDTWSKEKSPLPAPNPVEAARWLKPAAEAGDAEAQYRYGMLLRQGRTEEPDATLRAPGWLRKAAEQGHEEARRALGQ